MINAQLQIQFPRPGEWGKLNITAVCRDAEGYTHTDTDTAAAEIRALREEMGMEDQL